MSLAWANGATIFGSTDLDGLASSGTLVAGWMSGVQTCTADKDVLSGRFKANNTAPTAGLLEVWCIPVWDIAGSDTYADVFGSTSASKTVTYRNVLYQAGFLVASFATDTTANRIYEFTNRDLSVICEEQPKKYNIFVTHSMVQALNTTASSGGQVWKTTVTY